MNQSGFHFYFLNFIIFFLKPKFKKGYTTTIAGNGTRGTNYGQGTLAQFLNPYCVTMDSIGNIYVGDNCAIRMINSTGLFWRDRLKYLI